MKKGIVLFLACAAIITVFFSGAPKAKANASDGYEITSYDVQTVISEQCVYAITETIHVNFVDYKHGLYRVIPVDTVMKRESGGKTYENKVHSWVTDVDVEGYNYDVSRSYDAVNIKIGDPDEYVFGEQTYKISYKLHFSGDGVADFDEVYYNIIGDQWTSMTDKLTFSVTLPKEFNAESLGFSIGYMGSEGYDPKELTYSVEGNTILGEMNRELYAYEAVTMRMELPQGYFDVPDIRTPDWILMGVIGAMVLLGFILFLMFGIDNKPVKTVEFFAPEGMTPAEIGYINDGVTDTRDIVSLLIYWADKGYITIEKYGSGFRINWRSALGPDAKPFETYIFGQLFARGPSVTSGSLKYKFYNTVQYAQRMVTDEFKTEDNRVFTKASEKLKPRMTLLAALPVVITTIVLISRGEMGLLFGLTFGAMLSIFLLLPLFILIGLMRSWRGRPRRTRLLGLIVSLVFFFGVIFAFAAIAQGSAYEPALPWTAAAATALLGLFAALILKRTPKGTEWLGKIQGFEDFITRAEKDRIERLVWENPNYFYSVLPYAYVLNVTDEWIRQFEEIAVSPPDWYIGYGNQFSPYIFMSSLNGAMTSIQSDMTVTPSSSRGGSSGGGGFSGGGSSGGGGGGGGGGSW